MRSYLFPLEQQAPPSALPQNGNTSSPHPYGYVHRPCLFSLEVGHSSKWPNKIGGFVVQGILRFTHLLSCCKPIAGLPYKDNRKFAQSAGCGWINQLLVKFFMGLFPYFRRQNYRSGIFFPCCGAIGFWPQSR